MNLRNQLNADGLDEWNIITVFTVSTETSIKLGEDKLTVKKWGLLVWLIWADFILVWLNFKPRVFWRSELAWIQLQQTRNEAQIIQT